MDSEGGIVAGRRRVLVTGSNRGIGLELVREYAESGAEVLATCRHPDAATELRAVEGAVTVHQLDVTSEADLERLAAELDTMPIDVLLCNAAVFGGARSRLGDVDWTAWSDAFSVNVIGSVRVALRLRQNVAASRDRKIVFLSSRAGLPREAAAGRSYIYTSTKAALNSAVRTVALDLAAEGIVTALVNPGHVRTRIGGAQAPTMPAESAARVHAVVARLTAADAGKFLHFDGTELAL